MSEKRALQSNETVSGKIGAVQTAAERRAAMTWAQRLKRVFGIDIQTCPACGGTVQIIACIEDPKLIEKMFARLDKKTTESPGWPPPCRAPPQRGLFD